jgi:hypothetical protein
VTFSEHVAPITGKRLSKREGGQEGGRIGCVSVSERVRERGSI